MKKKTLYEILGVPENASQQEMRQALDAIEKLAKSPVVDAAVGDAENRLKFAHQAFSILGNPTSRAQYDDRLRRDRELSAQISAAAESQAVGNNVAERVRDLADGVKSGPNSRLYLFGGVLFAVGFAAALGFVALRNEKGHEQAESIGSARVDAAEQSASQAAARAAAQAAAKKAELVAIRDEALLSVRGQLLDQFSAHFQGLYYMPGSKLNDKPVTVVCGQVNAKNRFGGYVGWKDFIYIDGKAHLDGPEGDVSSVLAGVYLKVCKTAEKNRVYLPTD